MELGGTKYSNIPDTFSRGKTSSTFGEVFLNLDKFHLKKVWFFSVHNLVHAKCANFCFVGKEWPRNGYRFFPFFMPNQGGCFNLKCTGQQKGFFFCSALNMGRPVEKGCPLWHRKEIQSLYIGGPVGYLQFSSAPQANSLRGKFQRHLKTFGL